MLVTRFGVSVLKVVATIDTPTSHHGAERPEVKNSAVFALARLASSTAGMNDTPIEMMTTIQSNDVSCIGAPCPGACGMSDRAHGRGVPQ